MAPAKTPVALDDAADPAQMPVARDYKTPGAFQMALEAHLKREAATGGSPVRYMRLRKQVAFERFLARLTHNDPDGWALKGARALDIRLGDRSRSTRDVDLGVMGDEQYTAKLFREACKVDLGDFFVFSVKASKSKNPLTDKPTGQFSVRAMIGPTRKFDQFAVDVGYADALIWAPDRLKTTGLLEFAGITPATIPVFPIEQHLADKLHAYTRMHPSGPSQRPKDLVDMVLIAEGMVPVDARRLREAITAAFDGRDHHVVPDALGLPPAEWDKRFVKLAREVAIPDELASAHQIAAAFFDPVLSGEAVGSWNATSATWK